MLYTPENWLAELTGHSLSLPMMQLQSPALTLLSPKYKLSCGMLWEAIKNKTKRKPTLQGTMPLCHRSKQKWFRLPCLELQSRCTAALSKAGAQNPNFSHTQLFPVQVTHPPSSLPPASQGGAVPVLHKEGEWFQPQIPGGRILCPSPKPSHTVLLLSWALPVTFRKSEGSSKKSMPVAAFGPFSIL